MPKIVSIALPFSAVLIVFVGVLAQTNVGVLAQTNTSDDIENSKREIWLLEQSIYGHRAKGNMTPYLERASNNYLGPFPSGGWEPGKGPLDGIADRLKGNSKEQISMNLKAFTLHDDTAVIYYLNHRTVRPDGEKVDEWYEVMHVWVRSDSQWSLLASMPRPVQDNVQPQE